MDDRVLADLAPDERKLLAILRAMAETVGRSPPRLDGACGLWTRPQAAVRNMGKLAGRGLITQGGDAPFIGSSVAYRLGRPFPARGAEQHPAEEQQGTRR
jgi:hypothetical protein